MSSIGKPKDSTIGSGESYADFIICSATIESYLSGERPLEGIKVFFATKRVSVELANKRKAELEEKVGKVAGAWLLKAPFTSNDVYPDLYYMLYTKDKIVVDHIWAMLKKDSKKTIEDNPDKRIKQMTRLFFVMAKLTPFKTTNCERVVCCEITNKRQICLPVDQDQRLIMNSGEEFAIDKKILAEYL